MGKIQKETEIFQKRITELENVENSNKIPGENTTFLSNLKLEIEDFKDSIVNETEKINNNKRTSNFSSEKLKMSLKNVNEDNINEKNNFTNEIIAKNKFLEEKFKELKEEHLIEKENFQSKIELIKDIEEENQKKLDFFEEENQNLKSIILEMDHKNKVIIFILKKFKEKNKINLKN